MTPTAFLARLGARPKPNGWRRRPGEDTDVAEFLLRHARSWPLAGATSEHTGGKVRQRITLALGPAGKCFQNARARAAADPALTYAEGLTSVGWHAWVVTEGCALEVTAGIPPVPFYEGVCLDVRIVEAVCAQVGWDGSVLRMLARAHPTLLPLLPLVPAPSRLADFEARVNAAIAADPALADRLAQLVDVPGFSREHVADWLRKNLPGE